MMTTQSSLEQRLQALRDFVGPNHSLAEDVMQRIDEHGIGPVHRSPIRKMRWVAGTLVALAASLVFALLWQLGRGDAFAQSIQAAKQAVADLKSFHATTILTAGEERKTVQAWYKRPNRYREETADGKVVVDDGDRKAVFDPVTHDAMSVEDSREVDRDLPQELLSVLDELRKRAKAGGLVIKGPNTEILDGRECKRYEIEAAPGVRIKFRASAWFSQPDGLLRRMTRRTEGTPERTAEMSVAYNVDLLDELFVIPTNLKGKVGEALPPRPPELVVTVVDDNDRPTANAKVFFGNSSYYELHRTNQDGRTVISAKRDRNGRYWNKEGGRFLAHFLSNSEVIAESPDGKASDVFTLRGLLVVAKHGLYELDYDAKESKFDPRRVRSAVGLDNQLEYESSTERVLLKLRLLPKAVVTGRICQPSGAVFTTGWFYVLPLCLVRSQDRRTSFVNCSRMENARLVRGRPGDTFDNLDIYYTRCADNGAFRVEVAAGKPFALVIAPRDVRPRVSPWCDPAKDLEGCKVAPLPPLKPGGARDLGDIKAP